MKIDIIYITNLLYAYNCYKSLKQPYNQIDVKLCYYVTFMQHSEEKQNVFPNLLKDCKK